MANMDGVGGGGSVNPALRHWLWQNFGWDIYDWDAEDLRF